jgi:hypothetical protein
MLGNAGEGERGEWGAAASSVDGWVVVRDRRTWPRRRAEAVSGGVDDGVRGGRVFEAC